MAELGLRWIPDLPGEKITFGPRVEVPSKGEFMRSGIVRVVLQRSPDELETLARHAREVIPDFDLEKDGEDYFDVILTALKLDSAQWDDFFRKSNNMNLFDFSRETYFRLFSVLSAVPLDQWRSRINAMRNLDHGQMELEELADVLIVLFRIPVDELPAYVRRVILDREAYPRLAQPTSRAIQILRTPLAWPLPLRQD